MVGLNQDTYIVRLIKPNPTTLISLYNTPILKFYNLDYV